MALTEFRGVLSWHQLCGEIRRLFSSNEVDVDEVQKVMNAYTSDTRDWDQYVNFDQHRYTRNLVDEGNGRYNLIVLCWGESQGRSVGGRGEKGGYSAFGSERIQFISFSLFLSVSPSCVHDHANSHCFMKVLGGVLKETQFEWPEVERSDAPLREKNATNHHVNDVTYINGEAPKPSI